MKKLILSLVFIFAIGSFSFAINNVEKEQILESQENFVLEELIVDTAAIDCIALAFAVDDIVGGISYELFDAIVQACEAQ